MLILISLIFFNTMVTASEKDCSNLSIEKIPLCLSAFHNSTLRAELNDCGPISNECRDDVSKLIKDGTINVTVAYGYFDTEGTTKDLLIGSYWQNSFKELIQATCPTELKPFDGITIGTEEEKSAIKHDKTTTSCGQGASFNRACGFTRTDDPEIFKKKLVIGGKTVNIRIRVLTPEISSRDRLNRNSFNKFIENKFCSASAKDEKESCIKKYSPPQFSRSNILKKCDPASGDENIYQICRSNYVREAWKQSIAKGDEIVLYNGHARDGGGPSFDPPKVKSNGKVDYNWYQSTREGHNHEKESFQEASTKGKVPVIYGSFSCSSKKHFFDNGHFPEISPKTNYVLSHRTSFNNETLSGMLATLNGAFNGKCGQELGKDVQKISCAFSVQKK